MLSINLSEEEQQTCLQVARESIMHGFEGAGALQVNPSDYSSNLQEKFSSFVTLYKYGKLRGCIGALQATQPLINDISEHAYAAAFQDPRFPALVENEYEHIDIKISVLGNPEKINFINEEDLLKKIRPNIDGLILEHGYNRGTFLPSVWEQLPDKNKFLNHLKIKAGFTSDWWDNAVKISRYETFSF